MAHRIDGLPGDEHGHDGGLAGAGGQLQRQAQQLRVGLALAPARCSRNFLPRLPELRGDFGQPDRRLDRLDLAEERPDALKLVVPPVLEQARGLGRDLPVVRVRQRAPGVDVAAQLVDDRCGVVLLLGGAEAFVVGRQLQLDLHGRALGCLRFFALGTGVIRSDRRRDSISRFVG